MTTIYIYPKVVIGLRGFAVGLDRKGFLLKSTSVELKNNLEHFIETKHINNIKVDISDGSLTPKELLAEDGCLILISPYLRGQITANLPDEVFLTVDEFSSKSLDRIYKIISTL